MTQRCVHTVRAYDGLVSRRGSHDSPGCPLSEDVAVYSHWVDWPEPADWEALASGVVLVSLAVGADTTLTSAGGGGDGGGLGDHKERTPCITRSHIYMPPPCMNVTEQSNANHHGIAIV